MPDDAIERARLIALRLRVGAAYEFGRAIEGEDLLAIFHALGAQQALKVLLPPGACEQQYLDGWCDGQTYLIGNIVGWSAMLDAAPSVTLGEVG